MAQRRHGVRGAGLVVALGACGEPAASPAGEGSGGAVSSDGGVAGETGHAMAVDLVWPELWVPQPEADPLPSHAPAPVACDAGFGAELGLFEVDTALCNYGVFVQPLPVDLIAGERIELVFTHDDLLAEQPALGHIAVAMGERVVWEIEVAIPKPYDVVHGDWTVDGPIAAGTPIVLHLHNHGYNNWRVISFRASGP